MRKLTIVLLLLATLSVPTAYAMEKSEGNDLENIAQLLTDMLQDQTFSGMINKLALYKKAGLSYQPQLAVPLQVDCKNAEELRTLSGMYVFDSNIAMLFGKTREALATKKFIRDQVLPRLPERDRVEIQPLDQSVIKAVMDNPEDIQARKQLRAQAMKEMKNLIDMAKTDSEVMELVIEGLSGTIIQGIYVAANLAKDAPQSPDLSEFYAAQLDRLEIMDNIMKTVTQDNYKALFKISELYEILRPIKEILIASRGNVSSKDLDTILTIATEGRAPYVAPCQ